MTPARPFLTPARLKQGDAGEIIGLVEQAYGYKRNTLLQRTNEAQIAHPRHIAAFLLLENGLSTSQAGRALGGRHHTTVIHSARIVANTMKTDRELRDLVQSLREAILSDPHRFRPAPRLDGSTTTPSKARKKLTKAQRRAWIRNELIEREKPRVKPEPTLPDVATGTIAGMEDLDELILTGRGDKPRLPIEKLERRKPN